MAENGDRLDCPVCDDLQMMKLRPSEELELMLDYCDVCGGMWFESGEVRQLRLCPPEVLSNLITLKKQLHTVECPSCGKSMTRNAGECGRCGRENTLNCPGCSLELERVQSDRFTVDVCRSCRGVWFDNIDLSEVWKLQFEKSPQSGEGDPHPSSEGRDADDTTDTVLAILRYSGDTGSGPEDGSGADRNVFGTIADIIGGILSPSD